MSGKVSLVGVEIEGGWDSGDDEPTGFCEDGSVTVDADWVGEVISRPIEIHKIKGWIRDNYPDHINRSCGLHTHVSFDSLLSYSQLMSNSFYDYFVKEFNQWGEKKNIRKNSAFWHRMKGGNTYCKTEFIPEQQVTDTSKSGPRYTQLNYCYGLHRTLECRMLPVFQKVSLSVSGVKKFISICNNYLKQAEREQSHVITLEMESSEKRKYNEVIPCVL